VLLFVLWYCHKRGREVRLEKEGKAAGEPPVEAGDRVEELPDDPALPPPPVGDGARERLNLPKSNATASGQSSRARSPVAAEH
jgi:hypothetical protein